MKRPLILVIALLLTSGCSLTYRVLLGVDSTPDWHLDRQIAKRAAKYDIPDEFNLVMDTSLIFWKELKSVYQQQKDELVLQKAEYSDLKLLEDAWADDTQPTQIRLFDKRGTEIFKLVNCYVDPPIPMDWNVDDCFSEFPPKTAIKSLDLHQFDLDQLLSNTKNINGEALSISDLPDYDYYFTLLWNDFYKRPSKRLIKTVQKYVEEMDQSILIIYINNHNQVLWAMMDKENKDKVRDYYEGQNQ